MGLRQWALAAAVTAIIAAPAARAQDSTKAARAPDSTKQVEIRKARIEVPQASFNFGYVPQGSTISHVFWLKSVGLDTLRITDVRPG